MTPILTRIKQEQDESLLRIKNHILSGVRDLLFGDTAASIPAVDFAEEHRTQQSARIELPPLAKVMDRTGSRKLGSKRSPTELRSLSDRILRYVTNNPGERLETMAVGLAVPSAELKLPLLKLRADKRLATKGQRRAMRYFIKAGIKKGS